MGKKVVLCRGLSVRSCRLCEQSKKERFWSHEWWWRPSWGYKAGSIMETILRNVYFVWWRDCPSVAAIGLWYAVICFK